MHEKKIVTAIKIIGYLFFMVLNSCAASLLWVFGILSPIKEIPRHAQKTWFSKRAAIALLWSLPAFLSILLFFYGSWTHSLYYGEYLIFPSIEILLLLVIPIVYWFRVRQKKNRKQLRSHDIFLFLGALFPFLINDAILFFQRFYRFFEFSTLVNEILYATIFAAFFEELYFRFFLYQVVRNKLCHVRAAQIVTSALFALWHISLLQAILLHQSIDALINLLVVFLVGMISSELYERTGRLWMSILFHAMNNGLLYYTLNVIKNLTYIR